MNCSGDLVINHHTKPTVGRTINSQSKIKAKIILKKHLNQHPVLEPTASLLVNYELQA
jgi:hypothetical protein